MKIANFDTGSKVFIIAELSANHGGDLEIAKKTVRAAKDAGADCIKLQTYTADTITLNVKNDHFKIKQGTAWDGRYLWDLYQEAHLPWEWHASLFELAKELGLICFSSPFDKTAVDLLESLQAPAYKIASFEITDIPLIQYVASKNKPVIISTGIADEADITLAVDTCRKAGNKQVALLQCTSEYPANPADANLNTIPYLKSLFNVEVGLSDHTMGWEAPVVAVSLGARIIEKHFILDKELGGVDAHFSLDPDEFGQMVDSVRMAESLLGKVELNMNDKKRRSREFSRSLFVAKDLKTGDILNAQNVRSVRPGYGMHPRFLESLFGKRINRDVDAGTPLTDDLISD